MLTFQIQDNALRQHMLNGSSNIIRIQCSNLSASCACLACKSEIFWRSKNTKSTVSNYNSRSLLFCTICNCFCCTTGANNNEKPSSQRWSGWIRWLWCCRLLVQGTVRLNTNQNTRTKWWNVQTSYCILNSSNSTNIISIIPYKFSIRPSNNCINSSNVLGKMIFFCQMLLWLLWEIQWNDKKNECGVKLPWQ